MQVIETMRGIEKITYILIYLIIFTPHLILLEYNKRAQEAV
jgi:hypothetical protein